MESKVYEPDFQVDIFKRFDLFTEELVYWDDTRYRDYFDALYQSVLYDQYAARLWNFVALDITKVGGRHVCAFGFRSTMPLDREVRGFFYDVFVKHFPGKDGVLISSLYL